MHRVRQMPTAQPGFWRRREAVEAYRGLTGRADCDFKFYRVLALFRSAIVFLQLFDRSRRLSEADLRCADFAVLGCDLPANDERADYLRASLTRASDGRLVATPFPIQDSSMVAVLARAEALLIRPPHAAATRAGAPCTIVKFDR